MSYETPTPAELARIRVVGIDLMSTILYDPYREALAHATGLEHAQIVELRQPGRWEAFECGEIDEAEYGRTFYREETGRRLDAARFSRAMRAGYRFLPGMEEVLGTLVSRYSIHVLSNYPSWYEDIRVAFGLDRFVSGHHPSYQLGVRKPDSAYFQAVLKRIAVEPEAMLFIDDRPENVEAARALGIPGIVFESADVFEKILYPRNE